LDDIAWWGGNSNNQTGIVSAKRPNAWFAPLRRGSGGRPERSPVNSAFAPRSGANEIS